MVSMAKEGPPNFALLIGKKKDKATPASDNLSAQDHENDLSGDSDKEQAENSAVDDMLSAAKSNDSETFKAALKDFLSICYPQLEDDGGEGDDEAGESADDEAGENESQPQE